MFIISTIIEAQNVLFLFLSFGRKYQTINLKPHNSANFTTVPILTGHQNWHCSRVPLYYVDRMTCLILPEGKVEEGQDQSQWGNIARQGYVLPLSLITLILATPTAPHCRQYDCHVLMKKSNMSCLNTWG